MRVTVNSFNTLQHITTRCNTLQHTAARLHITATHTQTHTQSNMSPWSGEDDYADFFHDSKIDFCKTIPVMTNTLSFNNVIQVQFQQMLDVIEISSPGGFRLCGESVENQHN